MGSPDRDGLLRETYRLSHELGYIGFRHQYVNDPDAIREWPDSAVRERELRTFWDNQQGDFASYSSNHAKETAEVLTAYRDRLRGLLSGDQDGQMAYYDRVSELGRSGRLPDDGFGDVQAAGQPLPSPGAIRDERDGMPTPEEWRNLKSEWTHDYGLRRMEDRGVRYEDEAERELDQAAASGKSDGQVGEQQGKRPPSPSDIARGISPAAPEQGNGQGHARDQERGRGR